MKKRRVKYLNLLHLLRKAEGEAEAGEDLVLVAIALDQMCHPNSTLSLRPLQEIKNLISNLKRKAGSMCITMKAWTQR